MDVQLPLSQDANDDSCIMTPSGGMKIGVVCFEFLSFVSTNFV